MRSTGIISIFGNFLAFSQNEMIISGTGSPELLNATVHACVLVSDVHQGPSNFFVDCVLSQHAHLSSPASYLLRAITICVKMQKYLNSIVSICLVGLLIRIYWLRSHLKKVRCIPAWSLI
jgi:hypothetical protein